VDGSTREDGRKWELRKNMRESRMKIETVIKWGLGEEEK
jgi:hypothetical protein